MLLIDLDGFKQVNDNFGHPAGDELLRQVAARLSSTAATAVSIARLGGDEFALIVPHSKQDAALLALELIEALGSPYLIAGKLIHVTASIGVNAFMPGDHPGAATLLGDADVALYEAKASGRGCFCYFEETLKEKRMLRMRIEESLAHAIEADQISVKFHPQIDVRTGRVAGVEALARWVHPELGSIPVEDFIRIAEQKGLIKSLDFYILETACREVRVLAKAGVDLRLSVNVSPVEAGRAGYASEVLAIVDKLKFPHDRLTLELTENTVMEDFEAVATNLEILDAAGIRIAIDDFGSGYSNLSYLARFPFSYLKVDRRLAEKIENSEKDRIVLTNIARLARGLDLGVVMEGIETAEQLAFIQSIDIPEAQGFLFAQPLGDVELIPFLSAFSMKARPQKRRQFAA